MINQPRDRRVVVSALLLAAAGLFVLFQPFGTSAPDCVATFTRVTGDLRQGLTNCATLMPIPFASVMAVGLVLVAASGWLVLTMSPRSRVANRAFAVAVVAGAFLVFVSSAPKRPTPVQTALPRVTTGP